MGIVAIKNRIALILGTALEGYGQNVKIIKTNFDEDNDNKPQTSKQVVVIHRDSSVTLQNTKDKTFYSIERFELEVTVKDLRSDDPIQNLVDIIKKAFIGSIFNGIPVKSVTATNQGFNDGIWKYIISLDITVNDSSVSYPDDECLLGDVTDFDFVISILPSYNKPLRGSN